MKGRRLHAACLAFGVWLVAAPRGEGQATAAFDFDTGAPPLTRGQNIPFDQTASGVTAHFSSPNGPVFSIQSDSSTGWHLSQFSGNYLYDNNLNLNPLDIKFSQQLTGITLKFATADFQQVEVPTTVQLTAYMDSTASTPVGSATAHGAYASDTMPMGTLAFNSSGQPFNLVRITIPYQPLGASDYFVDNISVTAVSSAVPDSNILPQFAFGGGWYSALYFANTGASSASFTVNFTGDDGMPLTVPALGGSSAPVNLPAGGAILLEAPNVGSLMQGYASMTLPAGVVGYGVFRQSVPGRFDQEAVVPLSSTSTTSRTLIWDDMNFTTSVAIVNPSSTATTVTIVVYDNSGAAIGSATLPLAAKSKTARMLRNLPGLSAMSGKYGTAVFTVTAGNVAVLGLRFGGEAFTSIPTADK